MNRLLMIMVCAAVLVALQGCYTSSGGMMPSSGGPQTYISTETMQKTVRMVDVRTGKEFFVCDIPPGMQLVIDFDDAHGDDSVGHPDLMRYEVMPQDRHMGKLANSMSVPDAPSRRIDLYVNQGIDYAQVPPQRTLRTDEMKDRPDWWTAEGGEMPKDTGTTIYDN
jgi:hypothetical protein